MKTIGIFPASGHLGTGVYTNLLKSVPTDKLILVNRFPEKLPEVVVKSGVRLRKASYESSLSDLAEAFTDIEVLFLVSLPSLDINYRTKVQTAAIDAARQAGVKHIFYSSLAFDSANEGKSLADVMLAHLDTERYLRDTAAADSSFTYTSIREGIYAEGWPMFLGFFDPKGDSNEIRIPHDGSGPGVAWAKRSELSEATSNLILRYASTERPDEFPYINSNILLSGPRAWSLNDSAQILGKVAGREVQIRQISVDEFAQNTPDLLAWTKTKELARGWATSYDAIRAGETAVVSPLLEELLGRPPTEFDVTIKEALS